MARTRDLNYFRHALNEAEVADNPRSWCTCGKLLKIEKDGTLQSIHLPIRTLTANW
jgi:hypothetical protein